MESATRESLGGGAPMEETVMKLLPTSTKMEVQDHEDTAPQTQQAQVSDNEPGEKAAKNFTSVRCGKHGKKMGKCCSGSSTSKDKKEKKGKKSKSKSKKESVPEDTTTSEDESEENEDSDPSDESESESEDEQERRRRKKKKAVAARKKEEKKAAAKAKARAKAKAAKRKAKRPAIESSSDDSSSSSTDSDSSSCDTDSDDERRLRRKRKSKKAAAKAKAKASKRKSRKAVESSSDDSSSSSSSSSSESESDTDSEEERKRRKRKAKKAAAKQQAAEESSTEEDTPEATPDTTPPADVDHSIEALKAKMAILQAGKLAEAASNPPKKKKKDKKKKSEEKDKDKKKPGKKGATLEYKRVDQVWDRSIYNYKFTESAEKVVDEFGEFVFVVRRKFDWENKYSYTRVDIKSKPLREALQQVMKEVKGVSLVEDEPSIDPNMLFLYLDEIKIHYRKTLRRQLKKEQKKKPKKRLSLQIAHCKILTGYLDEDYEDIKRKLYPMLKAGNITFDLLWALFKPNTIAFTPTYGSTEDPRCFKVDYANKERHPLRGEWYAIEGRYLEYDGKVFGLGDLELPVESFKGPRKITSLAAYPLEYHKDPEGIRQQLVERGKKFVALQGMNYKFHKGLAYQKKKKAVLKVHINGRVMVDPAIFRRVNPNYPISYIRRREDDDSPNAQEDSEEEDCSQCCGGGDSDDEGAPIEGAEGPSNYNDSEDRTIVKVYVEDGQVRVVHVPIDSEGNEVIPENLEAVSSTKGSGDDSYTFTEEELLIASPVVLGFAFSEKLWLEFSLSGIQDIEWNDKAFTSLVLHQHVKQNLKGLVSTHKFHPAKTIDDVIQGKGKGLNVVLHGPPGVGKTLTAESIAEYLKCPLYSVSAGELGTDSRMLEAELNKIMDITHSWGAILLLDEADVFLEKREVHDIHRNALVSIFLRLLEYYQGILFLTTNRVETFDDAFQSRIHMAIRYDNLTRGARREVWCHHVGSVLKMEGQRFEPFEKEHFDELSKTVLNGRQIKNAVKAAQSISLAEEDAFSMKHIKRVLQVQEDFDADLRGGNGYRDAMRQYT